MLDCPLLIFTNCIKAINGKQSPILKYLIIISLFKAGLLMLSLRTNKPQPNKESKARKVLKSDIVLFIYRMYSYK